MVESILADNKKNVIHYRTYSILSLVVSEAILMKLIPVTVFMKVQNFSLLNYLLPASFRKAWSLKVTNLHTIIGVSCLETLE